MGDLNGVIDERMDKSSSAISPISFPKEFKHWLNDRGLVDVWHRQYGTLRKCMYHSGGHDTLWCIDYVFQTISNEV